MGRRTGAQEGGAGQAQASGHWDPSPEQKGHTCQAAHPEKGVPAHLRAHSDRGGPPPEQRVLLGAPAGGVRGQQSEAALGPGTPVECLVGTGERGTGSPAAGARGQGRGLPPTPQAHPRSYRRVVLTGTRRGRSRGRKPVCPSALAPAGTCTHTRFRARCTQSLHLVGTRPPPARENAHVVFRPARRHPGASPLREARPATATADLTGRAQAGPAGGTRSRKH